VEKTEKKKSSRMKATKDFKLLSFGEEAEGDEETLAEVPRGCLMRFYVFVFSTVHAILCGLFDQL
jgi:hypothetical protein